MPVTGAHMILHTSEPDALRAVLRDVFGWKTVDAGGGWLIFALPPAELGIHPADGPSHQISLMCDDIEATVAELEAKGAEFTGPPEDYGFGVGTNLKLPGAGEILLYQARHPEAYSL